jgi:hypothetical protein
MGLGRLLVLRYCRGSTCPHLRGKMAYDDRAYLDR